MKRNRLFALFTASALCLSTLAGCSTTGPSADGSSSGNPIYRVGFVNIDNADNCCYPAMQKFVEYVESDDFAQSVGADRVEVLTADSAKDIEKQTTNVETLLSKGVDMMFIIGVDTQGNTISVNACNQEGVPVFMVGTESGGGNWRFIGFNETELGKRQGEWCAANLPQDTKICYLEGTPGREAAVQRKEGFEAGIASRDDLQILSSQTGEFETAQGMQVTEDWIQTYGDEIGCIVAADGHMVTGAVEALKAADMIQDVVTCGVASVEEDTYLIQEGSESYAIWVSWPSIGTLCGQIAEKVYLGEEIEERTYIEMYDLTAENYDTIMKSAL